MATERQVILICDMCGVEDPEGGKAGIKTHTSVVDDQPTELEACTKCWEPFQTAQEKLVEVGRKPRKKVA